MNFETEHWEANLAKFIVEIKFISWVANSKSFPIGSFETAAKLIITSTSFKSEIDISLTSLNICLS